MLLLYTSTFRSINADEYYLFLRKYGFCTDTYLFILFKKSYNSYTASSYWNVMPYSGAISWCWSYWIFNIQIWRWSKARTKRMGPICRKWSGLFHFRNCGSNELFPKLLLQQPSSYTYDGNLSNVHISCIWMSIPYCPF